MHNRSHDMRKVFFSLCKAVDTPFSLACWISFQHDQKCLLDLSIKPTDYSTADAFSADYLCLSLLKKFKGLDTGIDLEAEAFSQFARAEEKCGETNRMFRAGRLRPLSGHVESLIFSAKRKIAHLLGPLDVSKLSPYCGWSPGATFEFPRRRAQIDKKICEVPFSVTRRASQYFLTELAHDLHWSSAVLNEVPEGPFSFLPSIIQLVDGCRIVTVPKSSKTDRTIAIEPRGNMFLQKGVGGFIRSRLKKAGVDLDDQGVNQRLAAEAFSRSLATLDLKAASDSVSLELVYELLPVEWAIYLDDLRSPIGFFPNGDRVEFEKFSSMGNGFTFELESLIFWAILMATKDLCDNNGVVSVYGDDLICDSDIAVDVIRNLNSLGFDVNLEKSFISGPFYESCGRHYFLGKEVTPVYQKELLDTDHEWIRFGNRVLRCWGRSPVGCQGPLMKLWSTIRRLSPPTSHAFFIPYGSEGDDGWLLTSDIFPWNAKYDRNNGFRCCVIAQRAIRHPANARSMLAYALRFPRYGQNGSSWVRGDDIDILPQRIKPFRAYRWINPSEDFLK